MEELLEVGNLFLVAAKQDIVHNVRQLLRSLDTVLGCKVARRLQILPVVRDALWHARRRDGAPKDIRVDLARQRSDGGSIRAAVDDPGCLLGRQIDVLETREGDVPSKVGRVGKGLLDGEEAQVLGGGRLCREAGAVVSVLHDDADAAEGLCKDRDDAMLEERDTRGAVELARVQDDDGATGAVAGRVEPVAEVELGVRVRLVARVVVEVVDGHGQLVALDVRGGEGVGVEGGFVSLGDVVVGEAGGHGGSVANDDAAGGQGRDDEGFHRGRVMTTAG